MIHIEQLDGQLFTHDKTTYLCTVDDEWNVSFTNMLTSKDESTIELLNAILSESNLEINRWYRHSTK